MKNKTVLITGIGGFVGSILAQKLAKDNSVYGLIRKQDINSKSPEDKNILSGAKLIEADLTNFNDVGNAIETSQPDVIFHLAAVADMPTAFKEPLKTLNVNFMGTANLLENVRLSKANPNIVFAGSSEQYGVVISSKKQYERLKDEKRQIFPEPTKIPELPIKESNPLRPRMSYGVAKLASEFLLRDYTNTYGMKTVISRSFNHDGPGRPSRFVTSTITHQVHNLESNKNEIKIGNVSAFKDWSHVNDVINAYIHLSMHGNNGDAYNVGSMRTNSVLSYILLSLTQAGYDIKQLKTIKGNKKIDSPAELNNDKMFGVSFSKTKADSLMLSEKIEFENKDKGILLETNKGPVKIVFDSEMFRPLEIPVIMSDTTKLQKTGFKMKSKLTDIIKDQLDYFNKK